MGLFRKPLNSDEYERLMKRLVELESKFDGFMVKFMSLRGLIHRKWKDLQIPGESEEEPEKENILKTDGLDGLRGFNK